MMPFFILLILLLRFLLIDTTPNLQVSDELTRIGATTSFIETEPFCGLPKSIQFLTNMQSHKNLSSKTFTFFLLEVRA